MMARRTSPLTHPLIATLRSFNLGPDDYVIFGSTPLFASGVCETLNDLDIVARGSAWRFAAKHGEPGTAEITGDSVRNFLSERIQFSQRWISARWDTDQLISSAVIIDGIPCANLGDVIAYKRELDRPHDRAAIESMTTRLVTDAGAAAARTHQVPSSHGAMRLTGRSER